MPPQEIGNLLWALARLGYMPAAGFALSAMPYIQSWRQSDVQVRLPAAWGWGALVCVVW